MKKQHALPLMSQVQVHLKFHIDAFNNIH